MDFQALKSELDADPLARGYSGMTDQQASDSLNTANRQRNRTTMTGREVIDAFTSNKSEWDALTAVNQDRVLTLTAREDLNPFGIDADIFLDAAAGATATIAALQAARVETVSRGAELGLGLIKPGHVEFARSLP